MAQAYQTKRVIRMRPMTSGEPDDRFTPAPPEHTTKRRKHTNAEIAGGIIAAPFIGGVLIIVFGLMVWASKWIWGHVL